MLNLNGNWGSSPKSHGWSQISLILRARGMCLSKCWINFHKKGVWIIILAAWDDHGGYPKIPFAELALMYTWLFVASCSILFSALASNVLLYGFSSIHSCNSDWIHWPQSAKLSQGQMAQIIVRQIRPRKFNKSTKLAFSAACPSTACVISWPRKMK